MRVRHSQRPAFSCIVEDLMKELIGEKINIKCILENTEDILYAKSKYNAACNGSRIFP